MYAHKAIDGLWILKERLPSFAEQFPGMRSGVDTFEGHLLETIRDIRNAQHFHVGVEKELYQSVPKSYDGELPFLGKLADGVRLPYPVCWFDMEASSNLWFSQITGQSGQIKRKGVLAKEIEPNLIHLRSVNNTEAVKGLWSLSEVGYIISIGKEVHGFSKGNIEFVDLYPNYYSDTKFLSSTEISPGEFSPNHIYTPIVVLNAILLLLGCKNIGTERHSPPEALNKKRKKVGKQPIFTYHTLVVRPHGKRQESIPKHLWENRIHLCRGHFKTYTDEKPLFGHVTGRFWWQPHVRGKNKDGIVMKDYVVEPI